MNALAPEVAGFVEVALLPGRRRRRERGDELEHGPLLRRRLRRELQAGPLVDRERSKGPHPHGHA